MCIANDKKVTRYVFENSKFCNCCNYKVIYILLLIFGYFGAIIAWIFTAGSIPALIWDIIYSLACIIATIGLCLNNYLTIAIAQSLFSIALIKIIRDIYPCTFTKTLSGQQ